MSIQLASAEFACGVVLYPETDRQDEINAALARQFGMVLAARAVGEEVVVSPVHAVGYDPRLVADLYELHNPGGKSALGFNEASQAAERTILDQLGRRVQSELGERESPIQSRRVDIIVPPHVQATQVMINSLGRLAGDHVTDRIIPNIWTADNGIVTRLGEIDDVTPGHPLSITRLGVLNARVATHSVRTSAATLRDVVEQEVAYELRSPDAQLEVTGTGFNITSISKQTIVRTATYEIPVGPNRTVADELARLDTQNQRQFYAHEDWIGGPDSDNAPIDLGLGSHAGYHNTTEFSRLNLARLLDPMADPAWQLHLN
jgi:hypothetical protein